MSGIAGFGSTFSYGSAALAGTPSYTVAGNVTNIGGPGMSLDVADVTAHDSTGGWEEVVATILRSGEVTVDLNWDPGLTTHGNTSGLLYLMVNKLKRAFRMVIPATGGTVTWAFDGFVVGFEPSAPHDDKLSASVTVKLTGVPTLV